MSDELDKELDALASEPEERGPSNLDRALARIPSIVELAQRGLSKMAICERLGLTYAVICRVEKKNPVLLEAFRGVPPAVVAKGAGRKLEEDPASPANLKRIQQWSCDGVSRGAMAALLKMSAEQFEGFVKNVPRIAEAIRYGEAEQEALACSALTSVARDPCHTGHIRAVLALIDRATTVKPKEDQLEENELVTPDQIREALRKSLER